MELNWLTVSIVIVIAIAVIIFLIWRNQKDKKELEKKLINEDEVLLPKEPDTEIDTAD
jgi:preprotein translocase subunit YajC